MSARTAQTCSGCSARWGCWPNDDEPSRAMNFDFSKLASADAFKLLSSVVVPRPIAWVVSQSPQGARNAAPFSFFNVVSSDPPIVALGIGPRGGQLKDTSRNILQTGQFVINLVSAELAEQMNHTSLDYDA